MWRPRPHFTAAIFSVHGLPWQGERQKIRCWMASVEPATSKLIIRRDQGASARGIRGAYHQHSPDNG